MILSRLVRAQLVIFTVIAVVSVIVAGVYYLRVPAALGIGRYRVTVELPNAGGLYRDANVTYNGYTIGRVDSVDLTPQGVAATVSLIDAVPVPRDLTARVRSVSTVGEQYLDLQPAVDHGPYLRNGDVIPRGRASVADPIGPTLDRARTALATIRPDVLHTVLDESVRGLGGGGTDLATLLDATIDFVDRLADSTDATTTLVQQLTPLLHTQLVTDSDIRTWAANVAAIAQQLAARDPQLADILKRGPAAAQDVNELFQQLAPTLPVLLANLTTTGHVALVYNPAIEQILVLLPPLMAAEMTAGVKGAPLGGVNVDFAVEAQDPAACTPGYLSPDQRRSPNDYSIPNTPSNLYCSVPHDSPFAVRGTHNLPCLELPGRRAASPDLCREANPPAPEGTNGPFELPAATAGVGHYIGGSDVYIAPDGKPYRHIDTTAPRNSGTEEPSWKSLLTNPIQ